MVTVPEEANPPATLVGLKVKPFTLGTFTNKLVVAWLPFSAPVIVTVADAATGDVLILNVADVVPAAIVTFVGTVAAAVLFEVNVTTAPPVGAAAASVAVPVLGVPPTTDVGLSDKVRAGAAVIVNDAVLLDDPRVAVIVEVVVALTAVVLTVNVAVVAPAGTVTGELTVALVLLDWTVTWNPPVGAAPLSVIVPVDEFPPTTEVGERDKELNETTVIVWLRVTPL